MKNGISSDTNGKVRKRIKNSSEFNQYADKTSGKLAGSIVSRTGKNNNRKQYMVKPIIDVKNEAVNKVMYKWDADSGILQCIREFLAGDFYRLLLNDQAPIIKLGKNEKDDSYFITSKIIENVETLKSFDKNKLYQVKGFEKVMASCLILWEDDYNEENLLIKTINDDSYEIVKVDHGGTFYNLDRAIGTLNGYVESKDSKMFFTRHSRKFKEFGYNELIQSGQLKFNINILIQELEGMLDKLSTEEVNNLFDAKLNYLLENNPKAKGLEKELLKYKTGLVSNINFMRDVVLPDLKIIAKFNNVSDEFKNGLWLAEFGKSSLNPIEYAIENNIKIEGYNAVEWCVHEYGEEDFKKSVNKGDVEIDGIDSYDWIEQNQAKIERIKAERANVIKNTPLNEIKEDKANVNSQIEAKGLNAPANGSIPSVIGSNHLTISNASNNSSNLTSPTTVLNGLTQPITSVTTPQINNAASITPITPTIPVPAPSNNINDATLENHTTPPNPLSNPTLDKASKTFFENHKYKLLVASAVALATVATVSCTVYSKLNHVAKYVINAVSGVNRGL